MGFIVEFNKDKIINFDNNILKFDIEDLNFSIITEPGIIKFQYIKNNTIKYIILLKDKMKNISHLSLIIQKAINCTNN